MGALPPIQRNMPPPRSASFLDLSDDVVRLTSDFLHHLSLPRLCRRLWAVLSGRHLGCRLWDTMALQHLVVPREEREPGGAGTCTTTQYRNTHRSLVLHSEPWTELSQNIIWPVLNDRLKTLQGLRLQGLQHLELKLSRCSVIGMEWEAVQSLASIGQIPSLETFILHLENNYLRDVEVAILPRSAVCSRPTDPPAAGLKGNKQLRTLRLHLDENRITSTGLAELVDNIMMRGGVPGLQDLGLYVRRNAFGSDVIAKAFSGGSCCFAGGLQRLTLDLSNNPLDDIGELQQLRRLDGLQNL